MTSAAGEDRLMRDLGDDDRAFGVEFPCTASCNDDWVQLSQQISGDFGQESGNDLHRFE